MKPRYAHTHAQLPAPGGRIKTKLARLGNARRLGLATLTLAASSIPSPVFADSSSETYLIYACVPVTDLERALKFYVNALGMIRFQTTEHSDDTSVSVGYPGEGAKLVLVHPKGSNPVLNNRGQTNRLILFSRDVRGLEKRILAANYRMSGRVNEVRSKIYVGHVEDPDGNAFELLQMDQ